jgi:hypothetical protein
LQVEAIRAVGVTDGVRALRELSEAVALERFLELDRVVGRAAVAAATRSEGSNSEQSGSSSGTRPQRNHSTSGSAADS